MYSWWLSVREKEIRALEVSLNDMRYINSRFTYLLTYLLACSYIVIVCGGV